MGQKSALAIPLPGSDKETELLLAALSSVVNIAISNWANDQFDHSAAWFDEVEQKLIEGIRRSHCDHEPTDERRGQLHVSIQCVQATISSLKREFLGSPEGRLVN
jgi:hypothetical protein